MKRTPLKRGSKPMRKVSKKRAAHRASKDGQAGLAYMGAVKQLPCCICGAPPPSDAHHCFHDRYGALKENDFLTIPLCKLDHQDGPEAIHKIKRTWREMHGPDYGFVESTRKLLPPEILALIPESK